jgi:molecular chaperone IbpA
MRNYDFTPLWRSTVGFDRTFDLLNNSQLQDGQDNYPPYDIARIGKESYRITLAVAGFSPDDVAITAQQNLLTVAGRRAEAAKPDYIYQGISARPFDRHFSLADYVEVEKATCENGLLQIDLVRKVPEAMKPRRIEIATGQSAGSRSKPRAVSAA